VEEYNVLENNKICYKTYFSGNYITFSGNYITFVGLIVVVEDICLN